MEQTTRFFYQNYHQVLGHLFVELSFLDPSDVHWVRQLLVLGMIHLVLQQLVSFLV